MESLSRQELDERLRELLSEDIGSGDVTTGTTVVGDPPARGSLIARSAAIVSGLPVAGRVFELLDPAISWQEERCAGASVEPATVLARLSGRAREVLTGERVALNLLQRMCGIATATRRFVDAVAGTGCRILDTRKTAPGLRAFDRQAVRDGGGTNHRDGLYDAVLIKDNHLRLAGGVRAAVTRARSLAPPGMRIEVEVESEKDLREAMAARADAVLIDNQTPETVRLWCRIAREAAPAPWIEASGGIQLKNVRSYAEAGPDAISIGALTHSVIAADIALELESE
jgi:nicotinate-nucleotide pyrophosphorylase (carboxylating)